MSALSMPRISWRWAFNVTHWTPDSLQWRRACAALDRQEVERIAQFHYQSDAKASIVGQLMFRKAARDSLERNFPDFQYIRSAKGKPKVICDGLIPCWFDANVAHQGDWVVLAAESVQPEDQIRVGVDVMRLNEPKRDVDRFFHLMKRKFTPREWSLIRNPTGLHKPSQEEQLKMFYRHWALKESFVKADGFGLGWNLQNIEFHIASPLPSCDKTNGIRDTKVQVKDVLDASSKWVFQELILKDGQHCVTVAVECDNAAHFETPTVYYIQDFEILLPLKAECDLNDEPWHSMWRKFCQMPENKYADC